METLRQFTYDNLVKSHYSDKHLLDESRKCLEMYETATNKNHPVVVERINSLKSIIKIAEFRLS